MTSLLRTLLLSLLVPPALMGFIVTFLLVMSIQYVLQSLGRPRPPFDDDDDFEPDRPD